MSSSPPPCSKAAAAGGGAPASRYCLCAPTTHPGSFRCRLHRSPAMDAKAAAAAPTGSEEAKEAAAAAAAARALLERMLARKPRRHGQGVAGILGPGPSRLGATATDQ